MNALRLKTARMYLEDAMVLFKEKRFNSAASRAYYASYHACGRPLESRKMERCGDILAL